LVATDFGNLLYLLFVTTITLASAPAPPQVLQAKPPTAVTILP
jgi:hypothetical protein